MYSRHSGHSDFIEAGDIPLIQGSVAFIRTDNFFGAFNYNLPTASSVSSLNQPIKPGIFLGLKTKNQDFISHVKPC